MSSKPDILFIHLGAHSFVREDLRILGEFTRLHTFFFNPKKGPNKVITGVLLVWNFVRQFVWLLFNIHKAKLIFCWFGDYHGFLPALFARWMKIPLLTVLGGTDANVIPSLNYGVLQKPWRKILSSYLLKNSTFLLPVDDTLMESSEISSNWPESYPNGLKANIKNLETPWKTVPTGYAPDVWPAPTDTERKKVVSTVAFLKTERTAMIKGIDYYIACAKHLPEYTFNIVGVTEEVKQKLTKKYEPGENVVFIPPMPREQLAEIYSTTSVYCQLSRTEGLPNVLCEAMMCGCIPVGSPVFGIPKCIGETGFIARHPNPEEIAILIEKAHVRGAFENRLSARNRILKLYSLENRKELLITLLQQLEVIPGSNNY